MKRIKYILLVSVIILSLLEPVFASLEDVYYNPLDPQVFEDFRIEYSSKSTELINPLLITH